MYNQYPKISVILITYNQENFIRRAIDSVINQKNYLHELIISDDCSQDKSWDIIKEYYKKFPDKIKVQRNRQNLGIYENFESTYHLVTGEIIFFLSGDDELGTDLLKSTCEFLLTKNIDYKKDKFCVLTDYKVVYPDGSERVRSNAFLGEKNVLALRFRGIINSRTVGESRAIFEIRKNINLSNLRNGKYYLALQEGLFDILPFYYAKEIYHIPIIGNIYYTKIGISTELNKNNDYLLSIIKYCEEAPKYFTNINNYDLMWLKYNKEKYNFMINTKIKNYIKYLYNLFIFLTKDPFRKFFFKKEIKLFIKNTIKLV